jgi:xanthine dehydrogenase accessory factor
MTSVYRALSNLEESRQPGALCTIIACQGSTPRHVGSKMLVYGDGSFVGSIGGGEIEARVVAEALETLEDNKPRILDYSMTDPARGDPGVCGGQVKVFVEPIMPMPVLIIIGGGHVGKEVAHLGSWLGFRVVVSDDRPEFCTPEAIPDADEFFPGPIETFSEQIRITPWTYFVLTTRSVDVDVLVLPALLKSNAAYIGVIGSRRRWAITREKLVDAGITPEKVDGIHSPIGLDLMAETPREIALSIMAEIVMLQGSDGRSIDIV